MKKDIEPRPRKFYFHNKGSFSNIILEAWDLETALHRFKDHLIQTYPEHFPHGVEEFYPMKQGPNWYMFVGDNWMCPVQIIEHFDYEKKHSN